MSIPFIQITFGLTIIAALAAVARSLRLSQRLAQREKKIEELRACNNHLINLRIDSINSVGIEAEVGEIEVLSTPYFLVYRQGSIDKFVIKKIYYNPDDPGDREYKRIHAEEVAEKLNEKL